MNQLINSEKYLKEDFNKALETLRAGNIILFPTDLEWAYGCDATNTAAVDKLFEVGNGLLNTKTTLLIDQPGKLQSFLHEVPEMAWDLIELSEQPLTIYFSGIKNLATQLMGENKQTGFRITADKFSMDLCLRFRNPILTLAPVSERKKSYKSFSEINEKLKELADYVVEYGQNKSITEKKHAQILLEKGNKFKLLD